MHIPSHLRCALNDKYCRAVAEVNYFAEGSEDTRRLRGGSWKQHGAGGHSQEKMRASRLDLETERIRGAAGEKTAWFTVDAQETADE